MADLYSDHYNDTVSSSSISDPRIKVTPGRNHATLRYKRATATVTTATAAGDVVRFFTMKKSDRLIHLYLSHAADASTSAAGDFGLYLGEGGALVDINLFCAVGTSPMIDITAAIARVDVLTAEGTIPNEARSKALWVMSNLGASNYGSLEDAPDSFDIAMTISAEVGIVASEYVLEAVYTSGGN